MPSLSLISRRLIGNVSFNLLANLLQGLLAIALIPLTTFLLGPEDYGVYGLAVVTVALIVAMCETGSAYVLYGSYHSLDPAHRASLQSTLLVLALALGLLAGSVTFLAWPTLVHYLPFLSKLTLAERWLFCSIVPLRTAWSIVTPILIVKQRSEWLAGAVLLQSAVAFIVILACLYVFDFGRAALFWGQAIGLIVCLGFSFILLRKDGCAPLRKQWLREMRLVAARSWLAGFVGGGRSVLDSLMIAKFVGIDVLGNYTHARVYQGLLTQGTNAFANVLWPIALKEAKCEGSSFARIRPAWDLVYTGLTCAGIGAVFLGNQLVTFLTHDKFLQAGAWLPWLVIYVLLQNAGKPATAMLWATKKGNFYSNIQTVTMLAAMLLVLAFVSTYGIVAVLTITIVEMLMMRVLVGVFARRVGLVPFQDQRVILGCLIIVGCWMLEPLFELSFFTRVALFVGLSFIALLSLVQPLRGRTASELKPF
jgi:O-antigen/teichoic acid export membrane protein